MEFPVLVRGVGEIASAVAHRLCEAGLPVALHEERPPATIRRRMAFSDALFEGSAALEGLVACRCDDPQQLPAMLDTPGIPILTCGLEQALQAHAWAALVDARMNKRRSPEKQCGLAPLVIGMGPGCHIGENVDVAVETSWEALGQVVDAGSTMPLQGEPRAVLGYARERFRYAPCGGVFESRVEIGDAVAAGDIIGSVGQELIRAAFSGVVRGVTRHGIPVEAGMKVAEVDPREAPNLSGIDQRPARIADAVLRIVSDRLPGR